MVLTPPPSKMAVVVPIVGVATVGVVGVGITLSKVKAVAIPPPPPPPPRIKAVVTPKVGVATVGVSVGVTVGNNKVLNPPPGVGTPGVPPPNTRAAFLFW